ncbi:hypothetical protein GOBAR_AA30323 [Gossypium barbadense]|uniref:Uncharacterized protein n=1 Tax=Gossypium barbadense TaxID=3634 RepID=A0A2P5WH07_GOSBA|nr:hypothetical protein GOBAR_AA30323 [Gossypium barbadense]
MILTSREPLCWVVSRVYIPQIKRGLVRIVKKIHTDPSPHHPQTDPRHHSSTSAIPCPPSSTSTQPTTRATETRQGHERHTSSNLTHPSSTDYADAYAFILPHLCGNSNVLPHFNAINCALIPLTITPHLHPPNTNVSSSHRHDILYNFAHSLFSAFTSLPQLADPTPYTVQFDTINSHLTSTGCSTPTSRTAAPQHTSVHEWALGTCE